MDPGSSGPAAVSRGAADLPPSHSPSLFQSTATSASPLPPAVASQAGQTHSTPFIVVKTGALSLARSPAAGGASPARPASVAVSPHLAVTPLAARADLAGISSHSGPLTRLFIPSQQMRAAVTVAATAGSGSALRLSGAATSAGAGASSCHQLAKSSSSSPRTLQMRMIGQSAVISPSACPSDASSGLQSLRLVPTQSSQKTSDLARTTSSPHRIVLRPSTSLPNRFVRVVSGVQSSAAAVSCSSSGHTSPAVAPAASRLLAASATAPLPLPGRSSTSPAAFSGFSSNGLKIAVAPKVFQRRLLPAVAAGSVSCVTAAGADSQPAAVLSLQTAAAPAAQLLHTPSLDANIISDHTASVSSLVSQTERAPLSTGASRGEVPNLRPRKPCNCTKSQCLKLYCDCFAAGEFCSNCNCTNCYNSLQHEEERQRAVRQCLDRNPLAFKPKIGKSNNETRKHQKGCHCKKSGCQKNYCECYEAKIFCSSQCKCVGCQNFECSSLKSLTARASVVSSLLDERRSLSLVGDYSQLSRPGGVGDSYCDNYGASVTGGHEVSATGALLPSDGASSQNCAVSSAVASTVSRLTAAGGAATVITSSSSWPASATGYQPAVAAVRVTQGVIDAALMCLLAEAGQAGEDVERRVLTEFGRCLTQIIEYGARKPVGEVPVTVAGERVSSPEEPDLHY